MLVNAKTIVRDRAYSGPQADMPLATNVRFWGKAA
jgi:hypothetical protein